MDILDSPTFKKVMYFKFFMVIGWWGLVPLLLPEQYIPTIGLNLTAQQISLWRIWGVIVLLDSLIYFYIYNRAHTKLSKYLILFAVADNGGLGLILLILTPILQFPWGVWINIPFQLFFGYWFLRFYKEGKFV